MGVDNKKAKRKPGGGRKKSKPDYNPSVILQNQMDTAVALYSTDDHPSLQAIADELDLNPIKVDRRENSKSLAWSSVLLAFHNIPSIGSVVDRPKALGDIRGVTYIYAIFYRFGLIDAPEKAKEKMEPVRNKDTEQMSFV